MILNCPNCHTHYAVAYNAIGEEGRTVRCIKCKHEWFQEPQHHSRAPEDDFDDIMEFDIEGMAPGRPLPNLSEPASEKSWMMGAIALFICLLGITFFQARESLYSVMPGLYEAVGYYPTDGIVLANVKVEALPSRRKKRYAVNCVLLNTSDTPQIQPPLAMRILSAGGNVLAEEDAYLPGGEQVIEPGKHVDCGTLDLVHNFASADKLLLEVASPLEMGLRSGWSPYEKPQRTKAHGATEAPAAEKNDEHPAASDEH